MAAKLEAANKEEGRPETAVVLIEKITNIKFSPMLEYCSSDILAKFICMERQYWCSRTSKQPILKR